MTSLIRSISSPKNSTRIAFSLDCAGKISTTSPRTRNLLRDEVHVVALILDLNELFEQLVAAFLHAGAQRDDHRAVIDRVAQAVDAGHRGDDDDVPPLGKRARRAVAQLVDLLVDRAVLFDIRVRLRDVRFRLVVVVVGDKVFHGVFREKLAELRAKLRRERLVVREHQRRPVDIGDDVRHRKRLAGARDAEQRLLLEALLNPLRQLRDRFRLIARRLIGRDKLEGPADLLTAHTRIPHPPHSGSRRRLQSASLRRSRTNISTLFYTLPALLSTPVCRIPRPGSTPPKSRPRL